MTSPVSSVQEQRRFARQDGPPRLAINLLRTNQSIAADSINVSEGGLCLRLQQELEVRSLVRLQLTPSSSPSDDRRQGLSGRAARSVTCTGRVAWVIQRLDLREGPPFLFDVGIEFVDPPAVLRQFMARQGIAVSGSKPKAAPPLAVKHLDPAAIRGRGFVPRLERNARQIPPWHLVVTVDGVACFSERFASERAALAAWARFKRQQANR
jgi:hypothetical protein